MILHILVQRWRSYHSICSIIWHWFGDLSLRGCLMGWGSCIHQWSERVCSFLIFFHWSLIYWWLEHAQKKQTNKKKKERKKEKAQWHVCVWYLAPLGTYITFWGLFTGYIWHCGFLWDVYEFSLLEPLLLRIWSVEGSCESSMRSYAVWIMIDIY